MSAPPRSPRDWVQVLARYRDPRPARSLRELAVTLAVFVALWAAALWVLPVSGLAAAAIATLNGGFLVRLFAIQHDCGHGAFFGPRAANDWVGRAIGVLTLTPYDVWKRSHAMHHAGSGNLGRRGMGDIHTMTVAEYQALNWRGRIAYRLYRNPLVLFGLGPAYIFFVNNRLPFGLMAAGGRYWVSAMSTNLSIAAILVALWAIGGWMAILCVFVPTTLAGATLGVWLFYVQHQFEAAHWDQEPDWKIHDAAMLGSSHYVLPPPIQWLTANIGVHHVHHLYSRIPFYRLPEVLRDFPVLADAQRMTIRESLSNVRLHLWDEKGRRLLSYAQARTA